MTRRHPGEIPLPGIGGRRPGAVARVRRGVDAQIRAQREAGQLEHVDDALVALARTLADACDAEHLDPDGSRFTVGSLTGRLMTVLLELRGERSAAGEGTDAELQALIAALRETPRPADRVADHVRA
jgi:hypothetical protein